MVFCKFLNIPFVINPVFHWFNFFWDILLLWLIWWNCTSLLTWLLTWSTFQHKPNLFISQLRWVHTFRDFTAVDRNWFIWRKKAASTFFFWYYFLFMLVDIAHIHQLWYNNQFSIVKIYEDLSDVIFLNLFYALKNEFIVFFFCNY